MTVDEAITEAEQISLRLRAFQAETHGKTEFRHQLWAALRKRGHSWSDIATLSGHSRERVRMILRRMDESSEQAMDAQPPTADGSTEPRAGGE